MLFPFDKRRTQESEDYHFIQSMDHLGGLSLRARTFLLHGAAVRDNNFIILPVLTFPGWRNKPVNESSLKQTQTENG